MLFNAKSDTWMNRRVTPPLGQLTMGCQTLTHVYPPRAKDGRPHGVGKVQFLHNLGPKLWWIVDHLLPIYRSWKFSTKQRENQGKFCQNFSKKNREQPLQIRAPNSTKPKRKSVCVLDLLPPGLFFSLGQWLSNFSLPLAAKNRGFWVCKSKKKFGLWVNSYRALFRELPRSVLTLEISV